MPILLVLLVAVGCLPVSWPAPRFAAGLPLEEQTEYAALVTAVVMACPVILTALLSARTTYILNRFPERRPKVAKFYGRNRRRLGYLNLAAAIGVVALGGWGWVVWHGWTGLRTESGHLAPGAELLVPAPYFLNVFLGWVIYYPAERVLHRTGTSAASPFWTLPGYVLFHARQFALLVMFPIIVFSTHNGLTRTFPGLADDGWFQLASLVAMLALFVLMPLIVKPLLGLVPLPPGPTRDRLEASARRLNFAYTDLLVWPTHGAMANAMVVGMIPQARYVVFTDRLLDGLESDELDAVFGHEVGHAHHRHIPYYAGFLVTSTAVATAAAVLIGEELAGAGWTATTDRAGWLTVSQLLGTGAYLFGVFGLLSRRCERQADVFGCRAGSCYDAQCNGHTSDTILVPMGTGLCPTGVRALIRALDRVAVLNGQDGPPVGRPRFRSRAWAMMRAWQHGPIPDRIEFLYRLAEEPSLGDQTDQRVYRFRVALMAVLLTLLVVLGSMTGWTELLRQL